MSVVYRVVSISQFLQYLQQGYIPAPVRAWTDIKEAERFSKQTGRQIILRLRFNNPKRLEGHKGKAVYIDEPYPIKEWLQIEHVNVKVSRRMVKA